jgi:predicted amidohydrolase
MTRLWKIAGAQVDCKIGDKQHNMKLIRAKLHEAAGQGAHLIVLPECMLSGYCFESKAEGMEHAEPLPGPSTADLMLTCRELNVFVAYGLLERDGERLFNACALLGPEGLVGSYRKAHLPFLGVDRFVTPGDKPFAVHDIGGLKVGMLICYDGSFPEATRVLALLGADVVVLPTNWPVGGECSASYNAVARAHENHIYFAAVNRVGTEAEVNFIGQSRIVDYSGNVMDKNETNKEGMIYAEIDPALARRKRIINIPGKYELDRIADRRPDLYELLVRQEKTA